jgi:hypothetical protein
MDIEQMVKDNRARPYVTIQGRHWRVQGVNADGCPTADDWSGWAASEDEAWDLARKRVRAIDLAAGVR